MVQEYLIINEIFPKIFKLLGIFLLTICLYIELSIYEGNS